MDNGHNRRRFATTFTPVNVDPFLEANLPRVSFPNPKPNRDLGKYIFSDFLIMVIIVDIWPLLPHTIFFWKITVPNPKPILVFNLKPSPNPDLTTLEERTLKKVCHDGRIVISFMIFASG
jgi:hypothetical protein